jgi:cytosine/adenosine deaminase-related metal-dependent hydrolase
MAETPARPKLLRARLVLPVSTPPIPDGAVLISRNRLAAVGRWRDLAPLGRHAAMDLGEVILMPGLVNAHCHLDYTDMAGQLLPPKVFSDWLKLITTIKSGWTYSDFALSWLHGAHMLVRSGTTTVADIEAVPQLLPEVWSSTPLRVFSFLEMISVKPDRQPSGILKAALECIKALGSSRSRVELSPHAPYTTGPELLRMSARAARRHHCRLTTHVAESAMEYEMFRHGRGVMFNWLKRSGRDMSDCGLGSPVEHMERCRALGANLLVIHANYLGRKDAALLGQRGVHVVHCPRSHSYFQHRPFPLRRLAKAGVNLCLGTDSLASVYKTRRQTVELSMFEEMRALAKAHPWLPARRIVPMATVNGAHALGLKGRAGQLSTKAFADLIALPFTGRPADAYEAVVHHAGDVSASVIEGRWAIPPSSR